MPKAQKSAGPRNGRRYESFEEFAKTLLPRRHREARQQDGTEPEKRVASSVLSAMRKTLS